NINPIVPSGPPSARLSYGFDGSGGLQLSLVGQAESRNKRFGMTVSALSYTLAGPIGGFHQFAFFLSPFSCEVINGNELIALNINSILSGAYFAKSHSYLPHIFGGFINQTTPAIGCCLTKFTQDTTLEQQRTASVFYDITPNTQITLRYGLNNSQSNFGGTPYLITFAAPPGYTGKYANGYNFYSSSGSTVPSHEIDQTYEWDIRSQIGKGAIRASYLS